MSEDYRIITLTGRPPVRIRVDQWPTIASADDWTGSNQYDAHRRWSIKVMQHADGRTLVVGKHSTIWQGERDWRGGELLPAGGDVVAAIRRVAEEIGGGDRLAQQCIAELPPVDL